MDMNDMENNESVREGYQKLGVEDYYKEKALTYSNPHEIKIEKLMNIFFNKYMKLNEDSKILDLCCGSGEITRVLENLGCKNIKGLDPFTSELYKSKTNKDCS